MMETKFLALIFAAALNPLVIRSPEPSGNVPADCEVSSRAPMTRIAAAEQPPEELMPLPPVRPAARKTATPAAASEVKELQRALAENDRPAFDAALARAKETGAATRVYEDIARLWDAQFESPFFSQESEAYRIASGYPGYEDAVRRQVFTDAQGRKFYPAAESRAFVAQQVGVTAPAPSTRRASASPSVSPAPRRSSSSSVATRRSTPSSSPSSRKSTPSSSRSSSTRTRQPAASRESVPPSRPSPDPSAASSSVAATEPAPVVPPAVEPSSTEAPPAAGSLEPVDTGSVATDSAPAPAAQGQAGGPHHTTTTAAPAPASKGRSIVLPAILILIGLGVLILLFRTAR